MLFTRQKNASTTVGPNQGENLNPAKASLSELAEKLLQVPPISKQLAREYRGHLDRLQGQLLPYEHSNSTNLQLEHIRPVSHAISVARRALLRIEQGSEEASRSRSTKLNAALIRGEISLACSEFASLEASKAGCPNFKETILALETLDAFIRERALARMFTVDQSLKEELLSKGELQKNAITERRAELIMVLRELEQLYEQISLVKLLYSQREDPHCQAKAREKHELIIKRAEQVFGLEGPDSIRFSSNRAVEQSSSIVQVRLEPYSLLSADDKQALCTAVEQMISDAQADPSDLNLWQGSGGTLGLPYKGSLDSVLNHPGAQLVTYRRLDSAGNLVLHGINLHFVDSTRLPEWTKNVVDLWSEIGRRGYWSLILTSPESQQNPEWLSALTLSSAMRILSAGKVDGFACTVFSENAKSMAYQIRELSDVPGDVTLRQIAAGANRGEQAHARMYTALPVVNSEWIERKERIGKEPGTNTQKYSRADSFIIERLLLAVRSEVYIDNCLDPDFKYVAIDRSSFKRSLLKIERCVKRIDLRLREQYFNVSDDEAWNEPHPELPFIGVSMQLKRVQEMLSRLVDQIDKDVVNPEWEQSCARLHRRLMLDLDSLSTSIHVDMAYRNAPDAETWHDREYKKAELFKTIAEIQREVLTDITHLVTRQGISATSFNAQLAVLKTLEREGALSLTDPKVYSELLPNGLGEKVYELYSLIERVYLIAAYGDEHTQVIFKTDPSKLENEGGKKSLKRLIKRFADWAFGAEQTKIQKYRDPFDLDQSFLQEFYARRFDRIKHGYEHIEDFDSLVPILLTLKSLQAQPDKTTSLDGKTPRTSIALITKLASVLREINFSLSKLARNSTSTPTNIQNSSFIDVADNHHGANDEAELEPLFRTYGRKNPMTINFTAQAHHYWLYCKRTGDSQALPTRVLFEPFVQPRHLSKRHHLMGIAQLTPVAVQFGGRVAVMMDRNTPDPELLTATVINLLGRGVDYLVWPDAKGVLSRSMSV